MRSGWEKYITYAVKVEHLKEVQFLEESNLEIRPEVLEKEVVIEQGRTRDFGTYNFPKGIMGAFWQ